MIKRYGIKAASLLLSVLLMFSCLAAVSYAVTDQDMAQISVTVSNKNPVKDEIITVKVSIDNYRTMSPRIAAMHISVSFDASCFDYLNGSAATLLKTNTDDLTSIAFDGIEKVSFAYTYANTKKNLLPQSASDIFTFKLRVKSTLKAKTRTTFTVNDLTLFNGKNEEKYSKIECKEPKTDEVTLWLTRPGILLNNSDKNPGTFNENVTLTFDAATASLIYEGRLAESITSPYVCDKNGSYSVTVKANGETITEKFVIDKTISHISVKPGTYLTEYPLGVQPDYSAWVLLVTYSDGTYSELPMDDRDIQITGFNAGAIGDQQLLVKYKDKTTHVNIRVKSKTVLSFSVKSPIMKTEYLIGDEIDTTGGVLLVVYDDGTSEEVPITKNMLSGYDKSYMGTQTVTVTYAGASQTFNVSYSSRESVDELIAEIDALDLNTINEDSREMLTNLINKYNSLSVLQKSAITNFSKLSEAKEIFDLIVSGNQSETLPATTTDEVEGSGTETDGGSSFTQFLIGKKGIVWLIVVIIIILSVIGGVIYFIVIYVKRKKETDDDEYYDDGDFEDDTEDDGDLSYEDDIIDEDDDEDSVDDDDDAEQEIPDNSYTTRAADRFFNDYDETAEGSDGEDGNGGDNDDFFDDDDEESSDTEEEPEEVTEKKPDEVEKTEPEAEEEAEEPEQTEPGEEAEPEAEEAPAEDTPETEEPAANADISIEEAPKEKSKPNPKFTAASDDDDDEFTGEIVIINDDDETGDKK